MDRHSSNLIIDNFILDGAQYTHKFITNEVCPSCDLENKIIYSPVLPITANNDLDTIIRGKNEHEAGHARLTPGNKKPEWSKTKGILINALEDLRIERGVSALADVFKSDLNFLNKTTIKDINTNFATNGVTCGEINEAIFVLMMGEMGFTPMWELSPLASQLVASAKDDFSTWKNADCHTKAGFAEIEKISDTILAKWESLIKNQQNNGKGEQGNNEEQSESEEQSNGNADNKGGDSTDTDKADNNGNGNGEQNTDKADSKGGDNTTESESGEQGDSTDTDTESGDGDGDGEQSNGNADSTGDGEQGESKADSKQNKGNANGKQSKSNTLDDYCDDTDMTSVIKSKIEKMLDKSISDIGSYIAYNQNDKIQKPAEDKYAFDNIKCAIGGTIAQFASYLEQSLRTLSRCKQVRNRDKGLLDTRNLSALAKSTTKNVFYGIKQGISLDTSVSVLIDESGSMQESCKYLTCRNVAVALAEVFERLGIKFEILGHKARYQSVANAQQYDRYTQMVINEYKTFNEKYHTVKYRLGNNHASNCNADGEALLHTFKRAMEVRTNRHIIIVLSDGLPSGAKDERTSVAHLMKVIEYCRKHNAEVYGFGIKTNDPARLYGEKNFVLLETDNDFKSNFFRKVANLIVNKTM